MIFNPYSIGPLISFGAILTIGTLAFRYNPSSSINKSFFYFCLSLCCWLLSFILMYNSSNKDSALLFVRLGFIGQPFIALLGYIFVHRLLDIQPIPHLKKLLLFSMASSSLFYTNLIYTGIKESFWGYYPEAGNLYFLYAMFFSFSFLYCAILLFKQMHKIRNSNNQHHYREIKYISLAYLFGLTGVGDFIAKYHVHLYPYGWLSALLFISLICYAILRYQIEENLLLMNEITQTEKFKVVATLSSGLAHEIKNPLTAIKTFSEYLPQKLNDPEFLNKFSKIIPKEVNRIDNLVHELMDFAKPNSLNPKPSSLNETINFTLDFLSNDLIKKKITLHKSLDFPDNQTILLDQQAFKQALLNILLNAIDAMPEGGILNVQTKLDEEKAIIRIQDNGCGIPANDIPHIFDPFFTKKDNGTGLGLSITHEIIKNHNGKIFVESAIGQGTSFIIELPN